MDKNTPQEILPGQFESLLKKWGDGSYVKAYPGKTIAVYFLKEIPVFTSDQKSVADKCMAKKSDGGYEFRAMDPFQKSQTRAAFNAISKATGLQFEFVENPTEGAIRIGTARTTFENSTKESGGVNFNNFRKNDKPLWNDIYISYGMDDKYGFGDQGYTTLLHEIGHALGLDHLSEAAGTVGVSYSRAASVMSYASWLDSEGGSAQGASYGMTPLILDILALQKLYGTDTNQGDNTNYIFDPKVLSPIERLSPSANDDKHIYKGQVRALWDTSGVDTLDAQAYTESVQIDLRPGYLSSIGGAKNIAVAFNTQVENVIGGSGNDELTGNEAGNELTGGKGNDLLYGGKGVDTYLFDGSFGRDSVADTDGLGQIKINGLSLGAAPARVIPQSGNEAWMAELAGQRWLMQLRQSASSSTGYQLYISKMLDNKATDPGNTILIDDFNVVQAMSDAGYLGIKLDSTPKLALRDGAGPNPFEETALDGKALAQSTTLKEHGAQIFTVYLNRPAKAGETITLALSGLQDKFKAVLGDTVVSAHGAVISLIEGQTQALVGLVQDGAEVNADGAAQLSATYQAKPLPGQAQGDTAVSNLWNIDLRDTPSAYALQGGYFVPGGPKLPGGTWQIQSDGSIPGMAPLNDANDLMEGGENEPNGLYRRTTGTEVDSEGKQHVTESLTGAVSLWGNDIHMVNNVGVIAFATPRAMDIVRVGVATTDANVSAMRMGRIYRRSTLRMQGAVVTSITKHPGSLQFKSELFNAG